MSRIDYFYVAFTCFLELKHCSLLTFIVPTELILFPKSKSYRMARKSHLGWHDNLHELFL